MPASRPARVVARIVLSAVLVVVLAACQVKVEVDVRSSIAGAGTVSVAVGLDDDAVRRLGDPAQEVQLDDLRVAGWTVTGPTRDDGGLTWFRATKPFRDLAELEQVLAEVAGPDGPLRDFRLETVETEDATLYRLHGVADLTDGLQAFSDPELATQLEGDPFGGQVQAVETETGRQVADMIDVQVTAAVGDGPLSVVRPTLRDTTARELEARTSVAKPTATPILVYGAIGLGLALVVVLMLVRIRRRFGTTGR